MKTAIPKCVNCGRADNEHIQVSRVNTDVTESETVLICPPSVFKPYLSKAPRGGT